MCEAVSLDVLFSLCLVFLSGAFYWFGCAMWVHYAERGKFWKASIWSMLNAATTVYGIGASRAGHAQAVAYIIGFAAGTLIAVEWKRRRSRET